MEDKSEELNQLQQARKELKEHLEEEFDPQARMEYQAELDSIKEQIDSISGNNELTESKESKKELEDLLKDEIDPQTRMEYEAELDSINEKIDEIYTNDDPEVSTTDSKETDEQNLDDENIVDELEEEKEEAAVEALELEEEKLEEEQQQQPQIEERDDEADPSQTVVNIEDLDEVNIIDADYTQLENNEHEEGTLKRTARLAKEYTKTQARTAKENLKDRAHNTASRAKQAVLNTLPFRIARGIGRVGKGVFKGFKTAALLTLGVGVISVEAVQNAKHAIEKASSLSIKDTVNNGRENANKVLDKLEEKIMAQNQQLEEMQNQHTHQLQTDGR